MERATVGRRFAPFGPLLVLGILQAVLSTLYMSLHAVPPEAASRILGFSLALYVIYWMLADARQRRCIPCYDFGFLLAVFFPLSLVWYAFWTRGRRGLLLLPVLAGALYGPWVCAAVVSVLLHAAA